MFTGTVYIHLRTIKVSFSFGSMVIKILETCRRCFGTSLLPVSHFISSMLFCFYSNRQYEKSNQSSTQYIDNHQLYQCSIHKNLFNLSRFLHLIMQNVHTAHYSVHPHIEGYCTTQHPITLNNRCLVQH